MNKGGVAGSGNTVVGIHYRASRNTGEITGPYEGHRRSSGVTGVVEPQEG
jgi:hypothetical protein